MINRRTFTASALATLAPSPLLAQTPGPVVKVGTLKMGSLTNVWVAKQAGFFERNGLNVELVEFRNGNEAIAAHQGGSVDILLTIPGTSMAARERGFDLVLLTQSETAKTQGPDSGAIIVRSDSPYKTVKDLEGKRVGLGAPRSQYSVAVEKAFQNKGADPKKVQFAEVPFFSHADMLRSGQIDAVAVLDPWITQLINSGAGRNLSWFYVDSVPGQPIGAWWTKSTFIQKNPEGAQRFVRAMHEAIDYMMADPARARKNVAAYTGMDPALVEQMPINEWNYKIDKAKWQAVIDMMVENGLLEKPHKADEYMSDLARPFVIP